MSYLIIILRIQGDDVARTLAEWLPSETRKSKKCWVISSLLRHAQVRCILTKAEPNIFSLKVESVSMGGRYIVYLTQLGCLLYLHVDEWDGHKWIKTRQTKKIGPICTCVGLEDAKCIRFYKDLNGKGTQVLFFSSVSVRGPQPTATTDTKEGSVTITVFFSRWKHQWLSTYTSDNHITAVLKTRVLTCGRIPQNTQP